MIVDVQRGSRECLRIVTLTIDHSEFFLQTLSSLTVR